MTDTQPLDVHRALVEISRLLVSEAGRDLRGVLAQAGEMLHAQAVTLTFAADAFLTDAHLSDAGSFHGSPGTLPVPSRFVGQVVGWRAEGDAVATDEPVVVALLTEDERFVGHLSVDAEGGLSEGRRALLSVFGDLLGTHLARLAAEEARAQTEERWQRLVDRHPDAILVTVGGPVVYANAAAAELLAAESADALHGLALADVLSASDEEAVARWQAEQLASADPGPVRHRIITLGGETRIVESVSVPFPGVAGAVQVVLRDLTDRLESEARYHTFVETISEGVWRVTLDVPVSTRRPARTQADHVLAYGRLAEHNPAMARMFWEGNLHPPDTPLAEAGGPYGALLFEALAEAGHRLHNHEIALRTPDGPRSFSINAVGQCDDDDQLTSVWGSCTEVTERVRMERGMVDALEEQQERIGRDLHDSVGQLLTGVRMLSESLATRFTDGDAAPTAQRVAAYASEALDRVREICRGLVPPQLYHEGLATALADLVAQADALSSTRCVFRHDGRTDLHEPDVALQFYRIAQEALANAFKHARARTVWVYFGRDEDDVVLEVEDDGAGFDPEISRAHSVGLFSMRRRAHSAGATLGLDTRPGAGTTVRLTLPVQTLADASGDGSGEASGH